MRFAPFAVFAAVSAVVAKEGLGILFTYGKFIGSFYLGLVTLWAVLIGAALASAVGQCGWPVLARRRAGVEEQAPRSLT